MPSVREQIEDLLAHKFDPNSSGSYLKGQGLMQYAVNDFELSQIQQILFVAKSEFTEEFYNVDSKEYLVWDGVNQYFRNKLTGEKYFIRIFYDQFDDLVQSAIDWTFVDSVTCTNRWAFGNNGIDAGKSNGMYISQDGGVNNTYDNANAGVSHSYIQRQIPAANAIKIRIKVKCNGENSLDDLRIHMDPTLFAGVADATLPLSTQEKTVVGETVFAYYEFTYPASWTGGDFTLDFQWRNDNNAAGGQPPAHVASVELLIN